MRVVALCAALLAQLALAGSLAVEQEPVVLGRTESVQMVVTVEEAPGTEDRPLQLKANVGSFGDVSRLGPGRYAAVYVPPATRFPQVALIAAWRETGPDAAIDFFRVPLFGVTKLPVKARAGSELKVTAGTQSSAPVIAGPKGSAEVPLVVAPGVTTAELTVKEPSGLVTQKKLPVDVPPYNRLTAALVPHALKADGTAWARLEVFYDLGGADVPPSRLKVAPSVGQVSLLRAQGGRYVYRYVPQAGLKASEVRFSVSVEGDPASTAQATLSLTPPSVSRLVVRPPAQALPPDGTSTAVVQVLALDASGLGVPALSPQLTANGEPLPVVERGAGLYEATFRAPKQYPPDGEVQLLATLAAGGATGTARFRLKAPGIPAALAATVRPNPAPADGKTPVELVFEVKDAAGQPLGGAALELKAPSGKVGAVAEEAPGRYRASWVPPEGAEGSVTLEVRDATGGFVQPVTARLKERPRFELGVRGGFAHSLGDQLGPRAGVEAWLPFHVGSQTLGVGLQASWTFAEQVLTDDGGAVVSRSQAHLFPVALRVGWEAVSAGRFHLLLGAGGVLAFARMSTTLTGTTAEAVGGGPQGFVAAGLRLGPGRLFLEVGYGYVPVQSPSFRAQAGGLTVDLGWRFLL